jgi:type IV pilus assembly protein PilC
MNNFLGFLKKFFGGFLGLSFQERINFARHLSVATRSGMPLLESLKLIRAQPASRKFLKIIDQLIQDVNNGQFLAQGLSKFDYIFGDFFISMVRVGETSGNLSEVLLYLAEELKKQKEVRSRVRAALIYPLIILIATTAITLFLTLFIFPKILPIFVSLKIQLPFTTQLVIQILTLLEKYGFYLVGGIIGLVLLLRILLLIPPIHFLFDRLIIMTPFISKVTVAVTLANFTRSLSVLLKSGMTIVDALQVAQGTFHNLVYKKEVEHVIAGVKKGESMARHLASKPSLFPPMFAGMIEVGESTGNLEENLNYLSEYYESEVNDTVQGLTTILEPLLLLVMGFVVGFVALSIITPIYKVTQELKVR